MTSDSTVGSTFCPLQSRRFVLISAILASSLAFIDGTIVSIAMPAMRKGLDASLTDAQWISNAYMLSLSALILLGGALGDRFGLRNIFVIGIVVFAAASLLCALAPTSELLIAARFIQGVGAAIMIPGSLAIISKAYPREERGRAIGIWASASAVTTAAGPFIGGLLLTVFGDTAWRWIFAINLPIAAIAVSLLLTKVPKDGAEGRRSLDVPGALLITAALGSLAWAFSGSEHGEVSFSPSTYVYAIVGLLFLVLFLGWQTKAANPVVPLNLFGSRVFSSANIVTFAVYFALSAIMFFLPMTLIGHWRLEPAIVSFTTLPLSIFIGALSGFFGALAGKYGANRFVAAGCAVVGLSYALLGSVMPTGEFWFAIMPAMAGMGLGMALLVSPLSVAVMGSVSDERSGTASGVNNAVSRVAGLFAVAVMAGFAAAAYAASGGVGSFGVEPAFTNAYRTDIAAHRVAGNAGFAVVAYTAAGLCLAAAPLAWFGMRIAAPSN